MATEHGEIYDRLRRIEAAEAGRDARCSSHLEATATIGERIGKIEGDLMGTVDDPGLFERMRKVERVMVDVRRLVWLMSAAAISIIANDGWSVITRLLGGGR